MTALLALASLLVQDEPVRVTRERLARLAGALTVYRGLAGDWPEKLASAARLAGLDSTSDGWGRPFGYDREATATETQEALLSRAIRNLAADEVDVRQEAERDIESVGYPAVRRLGREIAAAADAEVRGRLEGIYTKLRDPARGPRLWSSGPDGKTIAIAAVPGGPFFDEAEKLTAFRVAVAAAAAEASRPANGALPARIEDVVRAGWLAAGDAEGVRVDSLEGVWRVGVAPKDGRPVCLFRADAARQTIDRNERNAAARLKMVATAEADFRANDRDQNGVQDFWVADVSGLYRHEWRGKGGGRIMLIDAELAKADAAPLPGGGKLGDRLCPLPEPSFGYLFAAVERDSVGPYAEDTDSSGQKWRNKSRFGVCAYPADYGVTGRQTYFIDAENTVLKKDTKGRPPRVFTKGDGWSHAD